MGSSVSRPTSLTSFSVISAKARAAERCKSTLSLNERVVNDARGAPVKKFVVCRSDRGYVNDFSHRIGTFYTHFPSDATAPRPPLVRSPTATAHIHVSAWDRLKKGMRVSAPIAESWIITATSPVGWRRIAMRASNSSAGSRHSRLHLVAASSRCSCSAMHVRQRSGSHTRPSNL